MKIPPSAFWDFSLAVYPREGVESACLELQERHGLDVNLVLFCCWVGASGRGVIEEDDLDRLLAATEPWQKEVVWPIRGVRRRLKQGAGGGSGGGSPELVAG